MKSRLISAYRPITRDFQLNIRTSLKVQLKLLAENCPAANASSRYLRHDWLTDWNVSNMWTCGEKNIVCYFFARGECKWSLNRSDLPFSFISKLSKINSRQISLSDFQEADHCLWHSCAFGVSVYIFIGCQNEQPSKVSTIEFHASGRVLKDRNYFHPDRWILKIGCNLG